MFKIISGVHQTLGTISATTKPSFWNAIFMAEKLDVFNNKPTMAPPLPK